MPLIKIIKIPAIAGLYFNSKTADLIFGQIERPVVQKDLESQIDRLEKNVFFRTDRIVSNLSKSFDFFGFYSVKQGKIKVYKAY
ncbi:MAG: hypothetical protein LUM44_22625 [Pyrinomonadaceae bacterium]|nr:hypothetical protein [Pyrinomonadaceae bacterium]